MLRHPDSAPGELNTFSLKAQALFEAGFAGQSNSASRSQHTMPRQSMRLPQRPDHLARGPGETRSACNLTVGRHLAAGNFQNDCADFREHCG